VISGGLTMKKYDYIVAFNFSKEGYLTPCSGTMQISTVKKVKTFSDVNRLHEEIGKQLGDGVSNISIYNILLLGRNRH
jgi:hypothetical protein